MGSSWSGRAGYTERTVAWFGRHVSQLRRLPILPLSPKTTSPSRPALERAGLWQGGATVNPCKQRTPTAHCSLASSHRSQSYLVANHRNRRPR